MFLKIDAICITDYIKEGMDRNILCYDNDAKDGELTLSLISVLWAVALENDLGDLERILIPAGMTVTPYMVDFISKAGITIEYVQIKTQDIFLEYGGYLWDGDRLLIIGLTNTDRVILGSA